MASILKHSMDSAGFTVPQELRNMMQTIKTVSNPQAAFNQMAQNNPAMQQVMQMCNGRDPQQVFYEMCKQRGVDPESVLSQLR